MPKVTISDFAAAFGTTVEVVSAMCHDKIDGVDFSYEVVQGLEREQLILAILKRMDQDRQVIAAPERQARWNAGWAENLQEFIDSGHDVKKLVPKFIRPNQVIRLGQDYVHPSNPNFELDFLQVYRQWVFCNYLSASDTIYEFGAGTGFNLLSASELFPDKDLQGFDFVPSSVQLINLIGQVKNKRMTAALFDMMQPDGQLHLEANSTVFTFGALEQLAGQIGPFFEFLLKQPIRFCFHIEPVIDLYDQDLLFDYLAYKFHQQRGYTANLLGTIKSLEKAGRLEIVNIKRPRFASQFMEGYSLIAWRPLP